MAMVAKRPSPDKPLSKALLPGASRKARAPLWQPTGRVATLGPGRRRRRATDLDPRKAEFVRRRHEWYERQAALPARRDTSGMDEIELKRRAAACLEQTDVKRRVETTLKLFEMQQQTKKVALHTDWSRTVYEPLTRRIRGAVDRVSGPERRKSRRQAYDDFLDFSATASRLYLDDAGDREGDYDPLKMNRAALKVTDVPVGKDPIKRGLVKTFAEGDIMFGKGGAKRAAESIRASGFRTKDMKPSDWTLHEVQPRTDVPGAIGRRTTLKMDHFHTLRGNQHAIKELPRMGKIARPRVRRDPVAHVVEPVPGLEDDDDE